MRSFFIYAEKTVVGAMLLGSLLVGALTVVAWFGRVWWGFDLATHFRVQYFISMAITSLGLWWFRKFVFAVAACSLAAMNWYCIVSFDTEVHAEAHATREFAQPSRVILFNVNHRSTAYQELFDYLDETDPDILVLLEINQRWMEKLKPLQEKYPFQIGQPHRDYGVLLASKIPFQNGTIRYWGKGDLPAVVGNFQLDGGVVQIIGAHPRSPTGQTYAEDRNRFLEDLGHYIVEYQEPVLLLGDLNITPWSPYYRDFVAQTGLHDERDPFGLQPTWPTWGPLFWIPIDHCLVHSKIRVRDRRVGPHIGSDHFPLIVDFSVKGDTAHTEAAREI